MKILILIDGMGIGGAETHVLTLADALIKMGKTGDVMCAGGAYADALKGAGASVFFAPFKGRDPISVLKSICALRKIKKNGYTVVREIGGHGVGLAMNEEPFVSHMCTRQGEGMLLLPGMVFTIEPMINEGSRFFTCDKQDGWTVRTKDGKRSAQVEHMLLITENGYEILSR